VTFVAQNTSDTSVSPSMYKPGGGTVIIACSHICTSHLPLAKPHRHALGVRFPLSHFHTKCLEASCFPSKWTMPSGNVTSLGCSCNTSRDSSVTVVPSQSDGHLRNRNLTPDGGKEVFLQPSTPGLGPPTFILGGDWKYLCQV